MRGAARLVSGMMAGVLMLGGSPALALSEVEDPVPGEVPGPFVCDIGDSQVVLSANDDATRYAGELTPATEYEGVDTGEPPVVTLVQKYAGWRTVYQNSRTTMVIEADSAKLFGAFGIIDCFASRSTSVGAGWEQDGTRVAGGGQVWLERPAPGKALTWGGNVRSGPGAEFARVTGVPLGVEVETLAMADRTWLDEYPWFKVRLPGGKTGYIAGGLLCSRDGREGMYNANDCSG